MDNNPSTNGELYKKMKSLIEEITGEPGHQVVCGKFEGEGWLMYHYVCSTYDGMYPRVSIKQQKNAVHFYVMLWIAGKPILERYAYLFPKSAMGKGCLRLKKLSSETEQVLREVVQLAMLYNK